MFLKYAQFRANGIISNFFQNMYCILFTVQATARKRFSTERKWSFSSKMEDSCKKEDWHEERD